MLKPTLSTDWVEIDLNPFDRKVSADQVITAGIDGGGINDSIECVFIFSTRVRLSDGSVRLIGGAA